MKFKRKRKIKLKKQYFDARHNCFAYRIMSAFFASFNAFLVSLLFLTGFLSSSNPISKFASFIL